MVWSGHCSWAQARIHLLPSSPCPGEPDSDSLIQETTCLPLNLVACATRPLKSEWLWPKLGCQIGFLEYRVNIIKQGMGGSTARHNQPATDSRRQGTYEMEPRRVTWSVAVGGTYAMRRESTRSRRA